MENQLKRKTFLLILVSVLSLRSMAIVLNVPAQYSTIQSALNVASTGDTILVQPGIYYENIIWPDVNSLKLLSAGDTSNTIIDGSSIGRVILIAPNVLIDTTTVIEGFKIQHGYLNMNDAYGAGLRVDSADIKLNSVVFTQNILKTTWNRAYGAGIYMNKSNSILNNITVYDNHIDSSAWSYGAGIHLINSNCILNNVSVYNNSSNKSSWAYGTGIYMNNSNSYLSDITVYNNGNDTANWAYGAGIYSYNGSPKIINAAIYDNRAIGGGWSYGGGIFIAKTDSIPVVLTNLKVTGNYINSDRCIGAGIHLDDAIANLNNLLITSNVAGPSGWAYGGIGIALDKFFDTTIVYANNLTVVNNIAQTNTMVSGGLAVYPEVTLFIKNSIFWNPPFFTEVFGTTNIDYSIIRGGYAGIGNLNSAPIFVGTSDYHLAYNSPGIAAGDTSINLLFDIDNNLRPLPVGTNPDIGCYETDQSIVAIQNIANVNSDLNIFPNPSREKLAIAGLKEIGVVEFIDLHGKKIKEVIINSNVGEINLTGLENGFYFLRVGATQLKFVKQ